MKPSDFDPIPWPERDEKGYKLGKVSVSDNSDAFDRCIRAAGYRSVTDLCRSVGVNRTYVYWWRHGKECLRGEIRPPAYGGKVHPNLLRIMDATGFLEYELLPGYFTREYYLHFGYEAHSRLSTPQNTRLRAVLWRRLRAVLDTIPGRFAHVVMMRWGVGKYCSAHTLLEVARDLGCTQERVRQMEAKAFRMLRHHGRVKFLLDAMEIIHEHERMKGRMEERQYSLMAAVLGGFKTAGIDDAESVSHGLFCSSC